MRQATPRQIFKPPQKKALRKVFQLSAVPLSLMPFCAILLVHCEDGSVGLHAVVARFTVLGKVETRLLFLFGHA